MIFAMDFSVNRDIRELSRAFSPVISYVINLCGGLRSDLRFLGSDVHTLPSVTANAGVARGGGSSSHIGYVSSLLMVALSLQHDSYLITGSELYRLKRTQH
jgi:hypothetical protein